MDDVAERGRLVDELDERLPGIGVTPGRERLSVDRRAQRHRDRRENAPRYRQQMRRENEIRGAA